MKSGGEHLTSDFMKSDGLTLILEGMVGEDGGFHHRSFENPTDAVIEELHILKRDAPQFYET